MNKERRQSDRRQLHRRMKAKSVISNNRSGKERRSEKERRT
jgi:hypothetical protein